MTAIQRFFLRAKAWHLVHLLAPGVLVEFNFVVAMTGPSANRFVAASFRAVCMLLPMAWLGSVGLFLNKLKEPSLQSNTWFLWFAIIYSPSYLFVVRAFPPNSYAKVRTVGTLPNAMIVFCVLYALYFAAKSLAMAEKERDVTIRDYAGPLLLIRIFVVGVFSIQPRINRLYARSRKALAGTLPPALQ